MFYSFGKEIQINLNQLSLNANIKESIILSIHVANPDLYFEDLWPTTKILGLKLCCCCIYSFGKEIQINLNQLSLNANIKESIILSIHVADPD